MAISADLSTFIIGHCYTTSLGDLSCARRMRKINTTLLQKLLASIKINALCYIHTCEPYCSIDGNFCNFLEICLIINLKPSWKFPTIHSWVNYYFTTVVLPWLHNFLILAHRCDSEHSQCGSVWWSDWTSGLLSQQGGHCGDDPANCQRLEEIRNKSLHHCSWYIIRT